jgi:hypothetical protein
VYLSRAVLSICADTTVTSIDAVCVLQQQMVT